MQGRPGFFLEMCGLPELSLLFTSLVYFLSPPLIDDLENSLEILKAIRRKPPPPLSLDQ